MKAPLFFIQVGLLVLWYVVPAMAFVPWWVIFLPALPLAILLTIAAIVDFKDSRARKRRLWHYIGHDPRLSPWNCTTTLRRDVDGVWRS